LKQAKFACKISKINCLCYNCPKTRAAKSDFPCSPPESSKSRNNAELHQQKKTLGGLIIFRGLFQPENKNPEGFKPSGVRFSC
jgi:hypothetical protein